MYHVDFGARMVAEETDQREAELKFKHTQSLLIPELLLRGESQRELCDVNYQMKINKLRTYSHEGNHTSYACNTL